MKRQIRQGVFETNSSSTHSICIATETQYNIPTSIEFGFGEFGWEVDKLTSRREKANYLYTCIAYIESFEKIKECINFIFKTLRKHDVKDIYFESFEYHIGVWNGELYSDFAPRDGYVDHGDEAREFVEKVCSDEKLLLDYLFSDDSFILTGNDNDDIDVDINVDYPHKEFYKGN